MEPDVHLKQQQEQQQNNNQNESVKKIAIAEKPKLEQEWEKENHTLSENNNKNSSLERRSANDENQSTLKKPIESSLSSMDTNLKEKPNFKQETSLDNVSNNKRKSHYQLDPIDKSKYMYNKANNSRENSRDKIERTKPTTERKKSIVSINSTESKTITLRRLWLKLK
jgi:hypothetical protein